MSMDSTEIVALMETSTTEEEWNANADKVKADAGGDYPACWFAAIVLSGLMSRVSQLWA